MSSSSNPRKNIVMGAAWALAMRWLVKGIGFINTIVMARIVMPKDYGIVAMAFLVVGLLQAFLDFGAVTALLRKSEVSRSEIDSAWTLRLMQSVALGLILFLFTPIAEWYFNEENIKYALWFFSICVSLSGFSNIGIALAVKNLEYSVEFKLQVYSKIASVLTTIIFGHIFHDYRALIAGSIAGYISNLILSYALSSYRPKFDVSSIPAIWTVTKWLMLSNIGAYLLHKSDEIIAGRAASTTAYGMYSVGSDLGQLPTAEVGPAMLRALMPVLVAMKGTLNQLNYAVVRTISAVSTIALPIGFGFAAVSLQATHIILGENWTEASIYIALFSMVSSIQVIFNPLSTLLTINGHTKVQSKIIWIEFFIFSISTALLLQKFSLIGLVFSRLMGYISTNILLIYYSKKLCHISPQTLLGAIFRPLVGSVFMYFIVKSGESISSSLYIQLLISILIGAVFFGTWSFTSWLLSGKPDGLERMVVDYLKKYKILENI